MSAYRCCQHQCKSGLKAPDSEESPWENAMTRVMTGWQHGIPFSHAVWGEHHKWWLWCFCVVRLSHTKQQHLWQTQTDQQPQYSQPLPVTLFLIFLLAKVYIFLKWIYSYDEWSFQRGLYSLTFCKLKPNIPQCWDTRGLFSEEQAVVWKNPGMWLWVGKLAI